MIIGDSTDKYKDKVDKSDISAKKRRQSNSHYSSHLLKSFNESSNTFNPSPTYPFPASSSTPLYNTYQPTHSQPSTSSSLNPTTDELQCYTSAAAIVSTTAGSHHFHHPHFLSTLQGPSINISTPVSATTTEATSAGNFTGFHSTFQSSSLARGYKMNPAGSYNPSDHTVATVSKRHKKWQMFPGRNRFFCDGKIMMAKQVGVFCLAIFLLIFTCTLFFVFV